MHLSSVDGVWIITKHVKIDVYKYSKIKCMLDGYRWILHNCLDSVQSFSST
jgi:hypothetical protein